MGLDHVLILDIEGNLYGLGDGVNGQLGPSSPIGVDCPMQILSDKFDSKIKKVACGEKSFINFIKKRRTIRNG